MEKWKVEWRKKYESEIGERAKSLKDWEVEALLRFKDDVDEVIDDYYDDEQEDLYENNEMAFIKVQQIQNAHDYCGGYYNKYFDDAMEE